MANREPSELIPRPKSRTITRRAFLLSAAALLSGCAYSRDITVVGCVRSEGPAKSNGTGHKIEVDTGTKRRTTFYASGEQTASELDELYDRDNGVEITFKGRAEYWKDRYEAAEIAEARLNMLQNNEILHLSDARSGELHKDATYTLKPIEKPACKLTTPVPTHP